MRTCLIALVLGSAVVIIGRSDSLEAAPPPPPTCASGAGANQAAVRAGVVCLPTSRTPADQPRRDGIRNAPGGGTGAHTNCTYTPGPDYTPDFGPADLGNFRLDGDVPQMQWVRQCDGQQDHWYWQDIFGTPEAPGPPIVTPQDLIPGAFDSVQRQLPTPVPVIAPADRRPDGFAFVQIRTMFWVEQVAGQWAPVSATATAATLSVTVTAVPERLTVDAGDGGGVDCPGAPPALAASASPDGFDGCSYTYRDSSAVAPNGATFPVSVTVVWHATWQASNGASGDLGRLSTTSATRDLPVAEIQAVVTQG